MKSCGDSSSSKHFLSESSYNFVVQTRSMIEPKRLLSRWWTVADVRCPLLGFIISNWHLNCWMEEIKPSTILGSPGDVTSCIVSRCKTDPSIIGQLWSIGRDKCEMSNVHSTQRVIDWLRKMLKVVPLNSLPQEALLKASKLWIFSSNCRNLCSTWSKCPITRQKKIIRSIVCQWNVPSATVVIITWKRGVISTHGHLHLVTTLNRPSLLLLVSLVRFLSKVVAGGGGCDRDSLHRTTNKTGFPPPPDDIHKAMSHYYPPQPTGQSLGQG